MASLSAAAIVVSHARPDLLEQALNAVSRQQINPTEVLVVETSSNLESQNLASKYGFKHLAKPGGNLSQSIEFAIENISIETQWLWILHDDCVPESNSLQELLRTAETSPSVAIVGPKLLEASNPSVIQQLGLTTTRSGRPFVLVQEEYDQGQHDRVADVMATSTAGMLVALGVWQKLGGLNSDAPTLAQDLDFGIRVRTAGYRVIVEPKARVAHHGLTLKGQRTRGWLGGSWSTALAKSENYLATLLLPAWLAALRLLILPLLAFAFIPVHIYSKKPSRIYADFLSWMWTWLLLPKILRGRSRLRELGRPSSLSNLFANSSQLKRRRESKLDYVASSDSNEQSGLVGSGAIWAIAIPLLLSYNWFPSGPALKLGSLVYIAPNLGEWLTTVSTNLVTGFNGNFVTMDPFTWAYGFFAFANPGAPSFALALFMMLAPALAFITAWKLFAVQNQSRLLVTLFALGYALVAGIGRSIGGLEVAVVSVVAPLAIWSLIRAIRAETSSRSWRWIGLAGLALALVAIGSPVLFALFILIGAAIAVGHRSRLLAPVVAAVPGLALLTPYLLASSSPVDWIFSFQSAQFVSDWDRYPFYLLLLAPLALLALLGIFWAPIGRSSLLAVFASLNLLLAVVIPSWANQVMFLLTAFLGLSQLGIEFLVKVKKPWVSVLLATPAILWVAFLSSSTQISSAIEFSEARNVPALIEAAHATGEEVRTLSIEIQNEQVLGHLIMGNGVQLHESSYLASKKQLPDFEYQELLSSIAARVVTGNAQGLEQQLIAAELDFILLETSETGYEVSAAAGLRTMNFLQPAGDTEYGKLFRVNNSDSAKAPLPQESPWATLQFGVLAVFALLAIPTPASIFGTRRRTENLGGDEQ